jgi:carbon-monoxide dehydrogenase large subunit
MIVKGQIHGGLVQGIGQALCEACVYDEQSGQLLSGSFMDYCMPRADDIPTMHVETLSTECTHNPLGVKGCGELGTIGAPATVMNAVVDALSHLGVAHLDMPASPGRVWRTINNARLGSAA